MNMAIVIKITILYALFSSSFTFDIKRRSQSSSSSIFPKCSGRIFADEESVVESSICVLHGYNITIILSFECILFKKLEQQDVINSHHPFRC